MWTATPSPARPTGTARKYQKLKLKADTAAEFNAEYPDGWTDGWIASLQHHFVVAIVPPTREEQHRHTLSVSGDMFRFSDVGPAVTVAPGASAELKQTLFVGPKLQHQLAAIHPELERAADFGVLTFIAQPLFWLLEKAHSIFGNWGFAIIAVTFLLKLAFYPLSEIAGRSAAKMKMMAPRMKQLQETYKDDRAKLGQATMELYKKEKINPAAGLPADADPAAGVHGLLLGAAGKRGNAPGAVHRLDPRSVVARSAVHPAGDHGRRDVPAVQDPAAVG